MQIQKPKLSHNLEASQFYEALSVLKRYEHGFIVIPIILICRKIGLFQLLEARKSLQIYQIAEQLSANTGPLKAVLNTLQSLQWVKCNREEEYTLLAKGESFYHKFPQGALKFLQPPLDCYFEKLSIYDLRTALKCVKQRWKLDDELLSDFLDGLIVVPILLALHQLGELNTNHQTLQFKKLTSGQRELLYQLFDFKGWSELRNGKYSLSPLGQFICNRALTWRITASYQPMLLQLETLLVGDYQAVFSTDFIGQENHIDRALNVIGSGYQHQKYFIDMGDMILELFDRLPYENQPTCIIDTGCGDGSLLKQIYELIVTRSQRGSVLTEYPLLLIGVDYSSLSLQNAAQNLNDIPSLVLQGDIGNPQQIMADLIENGVVQQENVLHIRSFLDHERPFSMPQRKAEAKLRKRYNYQGAYINERGQIITPEVLVQNLVEHFERWAAVVNQYGLILLEVHCLNPEIVYHHIDQCKNLHFDIYHALSMQYLVEPQVFLMCAAEAGLFSKPNCSQYYPRRLPFTRITLDWLEKRNYRIRQSRVSDLPALIELESTCWPSNLCVTAATIQRWLNQFPVGQFLVEVKDQIVGAIYSQRIANLKSLNKVEFSKIHLLHDADGSIIQLLGISISPTMRRQGLGNSLRQFMLLYFRLMPGIERVVGITRCHNYIQHQDVSIETYLQWRNDQGEHIDPVIRFHENGGATLHSIIPNYRPSDTDNQGCGVLIQYDLDKCLPKQVLPA